MVDKQIEQVERSRLTAMVDALDMRIYLVDHAMRVLEQAGGTSPTWSDEPLPCSIRGHSLAFDDFHLNRDAGAAVRAVCTGSSTRPKMFVHKSAMSQTQWRIMVLAPSDQPGHCVICVSQPARAVARRPLWLGQVYGLTAAEIEVVMAISSGLTAEEAAASRRTTVATVRSQIRSALSKTEVRRMAELIALVCSLP